jgi:cell shape-determining protein MreC
MKKPFSQRRRYGAEVSAVSRVVWGGGVAILVVVIIVAVRAFLPDVFVALASPMWQTGTSLTTAVNDSSAIFDNKTKLAAENSALAQQVQTLTNENQVLTARSQDLTKLLGGLSSTGGEVLAGVLARPPESPYDTLMIAAGTDDKIVVNAFVYSAGGTPIGTIEHVTNATSQVSLFSTTGRNTDGWIGENRIPVTLTGMGAGAFSSTIPATASVAVGDTVYVPGPGALPIGSVVKIDTDPSSPTEVLHIQPLVNIFSITWVEVAQES